MSERREAVEAHVLTVYRKENPSTYFADTSEDAFASYEFRRESLFRDQLKFPTRMFKGMSLLDFGGGTGEHTIHYARWGAHCTLVEMNPDAVQRAKSMFERFLPAHNDFNHQFVNRSLFDFKSNQLYDIVLSDAVLHHTADKRGGFRHLASFLAPGGYAVLGIGDRAACFQRMLQRMLIFRFAKSDDEIVNVAEALFSEHVDRAQKFGGRTRRAIIFDAFVNPKVDNPSVADVLHWFDENGLKFYSAWPPFLPPVLGDSGARSTFSPSQMHEIGALAEATWLCHDVDDKDDVPTIAKGMNELHHAQEILVGHLNDFAPDQDLSAKKFSKACDLYLTMLEDVQIIRRLSEKTRRMLEEAEEVVQLAADGDLTRLAQKTSATKHLFRGTSGLGMNYFVGYRPQ